MQRKEVLVLILVLVAFMLFAGFSRQAPIQTEGKAIYGYTCENPCDDYMRNYPGATLVKRDLMTTMFTFSAGLMANITMQLLLPVQKSVAHASLK